MRVESDEMYETIVDSMAWRPYASLTDMQRSVLRNKLTIVPRQTSAHAKKIQPIELFREDDERELFGIPREYYMRKRTVEHPIVDRTSSGAPMSELDCRIRHTGQFQEQAESVDKLEGILRARPWGGTIFQAGCGSGKTVCGLSLAYRLGMRTMILVHKDFLMTQWAERIQEFFPEARIGIVKQDRCEFAGMDFVIGMLSSLAKRKKYPPELYSSAGFVIADEVHRVGALTWAPVLPRFSARYRLGLSATVGRKDGADRVFWDHIGQIGHKHRGKAMTPELRVLSTTFEPHAVMKEGGRIRMPDRLTLAEIEPQIAADELRTRLIVDDVIEAALAGRKIMVLGKRLDHLHRIKVQLEQQLGARGRSDVRVDYYTGKCLENRPSGLVDVKRTEVQLKHAEGANIILATAQLVNEALDIPALDVLCIATPISDVEQAVGRVQRFCLPQEKKCKRLCKWRAGSCAGKPSPIVTDVVDVQLALARSSYGNRAAVYARLGMSVGRTGVLARRAR